jgi:hypothetical protein
MTNSYRPWLHRWAVLTAVAIFPLLLVGGAVTSMKVGMADPEWPTPPWYLLVTSWAELAVARGIGFLVEHGHRQIGWIVGVFSIVLAVWLWRVEERRWLRKLGLLALAAVCLQGLLGGLRVRMNEWAGLELAMVHGCLGQLVFCLMAAIALFTSRSWIAAEAAETDEAARVQRLGVILTCLITTQLLAGVWLRQQGQGLWIHLLLALAVAAHVLMIGQRAMSLRERSAYLHRPAMLLVILLVTQLSLGLAAWWFGGGVGAIDEQPVNIHRAVFATFHVGIGALLLMTSVLMTLRLHRHLSPQAKPVMMPLGTAEGTA